MSSLFIWNTAENIGMTLRELSAEELANALAQLPVDTPEFYIVITTAQIILSGYPTSARFFRHPAELNDSPRDQLWVTVLTGSSPNWISVNFSCPPAFAQNKAQKLGAVFTQFAELYPSITTLKTQLLYGNEFITSKFLDWAQKLLPPVNYNIYPTVPFYLAKDAYEQLRNSDDSPPSGFIFTKPNVDVDVAEILERIYALAIPQSASYLRAKLELLPSVFVREVTTGRLAGCYLVDPRGVLNMQFTYDEFRGRGIGHVMERRLLRECLRFGFKFPMKAIQVTNDRLIRNHANSDVWRVWEDADGKPIHYWYALRADCFE